MIVRIATEGQYRLDDDLKARVNELDNAAVAAVEADNEDGFHENFEELLNLVRTRGEPIDDELIESDVIIPPPDLSFQEAKSEFVGEGLLPD